MAAKAEVSNMRRCPLCRVVRQEPFLAHCCGWCEKLMEEEMLAQGGN